jgi:hypothetical protein
MELRLQALYEELACNDMQQLLLLILTEDPVALLCDFFLW